MNAVFRMLACLVILAAAGAGGCGSKHPPTYRVCGTVKFADGKPLANGWVMFRGVAGDTHATARGQIQPDGTFELGTYKPGDGAVEGEHQALVAPLMPSTDAEARRLSSVMNPRFRSFETSGLRFTVSSDPAKNQFAIRVER